MNKPSLTIIIPNYNKAQFLPVCIKSIMNQSWTPNEIIVVDDCSSDNSREIIMDYERQYSIIKGIFLDSNGGVSRARNIGLNAAASEYVCFTDSDDYYYSEDKLKNEMSLLMRMKDRNIEVAVYSAVVKVDEGGEIIERPKLNSLLFLNGNVKLDFIARSKKETIPRDYCIKRELVLRAGAYSFYKDFYEDLDLLMRLSQKVPFYWSHGYGVAYRQTSGGLSKRRRDEHRKTVKEIVDVYYDRLNLFEKPVILIKKIVWYFESRAYRAVKLILRKLSGGRLNENSSTCSNKA